MINKNHFDDERILSHSFFRKLGLPSGEDSEILESYSVGAVANEGAAAMKERLNQLKEIKFALAAYTKKILKYHEQLEKIQQRFLKSYLDLDGSDDGMFKEKSRRVQCLSAVYAYIIGVVGNLQKTVLKMIRDYESELDAQYRRELGDRVRKARQALNLTQQDCALAARVSRQMINQFELGRKELNFPTFHRLIHFLGADARTILG